MGMDLTLIPYKNGNEEKMKSDIWILAHTRIDLIRNYELFSYFKEMGLGFKTPKIETKELNKEVDWYGDEGIEEITEDAYGGSLTYCLAEEFNKIDSTKLDTGYWNKAVIEMMKQLPPDTPIILYWH